MRLKIFVLPIRFIPLTRVPPARFLLVFLIAAFAQHASIAQQKMPEFGKADLAELNMKECSFEKNAGAMNLIRTSRINFEVSEYSYAPIITTEYWARIKIFSRRGFPAASIKIPYFSKSRSSRVKDIEAFIYTLDPDGKPIRQKVEKKEIFNERAGAGVSLNYIAFTFPNLKEGAVVEYRYKKVDKNTITISPWFFQEDIPTAFSKVSAVVPAYATMTYHVLATDPVEKDSSYKTYYRTIFNETTHSYAIRNIHSFRVEPLMTSLADNLERVEFALAPGNAGWGFFSTPDYKWRMYTYHLLKAPYFGAQFGVPIPAADPFMDSVKKLVRTEDKISAVYRYVKRNIGWDKEQTFYCDSLVNCWRDRSGSSAEINISFLNLLRRAGVTCYPILVSTRENGNPDTDFPSLPQFNGVDVLVMDSTVHYAVDCTQKQLSFKIPPFNILNSFARVMFSSFRKNPFIDTVRYSDIDFGCNQSMTVRIRIQLPANMLIESRPKDISIHKEDSTILFDRNISADKGTLLINNFFTLKNAVFFKDDYASLKSFFDKFYGLLNEEIILKKKG